MFVGVISVSFSIPISILYSISYTYTHNWWPVLLFCAVYKNINLNSWCFTWRLRKSSWWTTHIHHCPPMLKPYMGTDRPVAHDESRLQSQSLRFHDSFLQNDSSVCKIWTMRNCDTQVFPFNRVKCASRNFPEISSCDINQSYNCFSTFMFVSCQAWLLLSSLWFLA